MAKPQKTPRYKPARPKRERPSRRRGVASTPMKTEAPGNSRAVYLFFATAALWALFLSGAAEGFGPPGTLSSIVLGAAVMTLVLALMALFRSRSA